MAVVAFLAKLETRKTSVTNEIIPRIKRITLNGLIKARRNRRIIVSFFAPQTCSHRIFFPHRFDLFMRQAIRMTLQYLDIFVMPHGKRIF